MAEGDFLPNINTADLLNILADGESLTDVFQSTIGIDAELEILEQPKQRGFRFRYSCEGPSHGGLPGEQSAKGRKTFPSVQINNYFGKARIEVTLVTVADPPMPHAHSLVGKNVNEGACVVEVGPECGMTASFPNLGIQHVTKKNVKSVLKERYLKRCQLEKSMTSHAGQPMHVDLSTQGGPSNEEALARAITDAEMTKIEQQVEQEAKNMNLSTVRLCFQTYLPNESGHFVNCLKPVYSHPIFDSKAAAASELKICRIDKQAGSVQGGDEVFLLCDKVQKEDIEIRFYENPEDEQQKPWEAFGKFSTSDVHRQFAIVFKTPEYWNSAIEKPVQVLLELRRRSDKERSQPIEFTYKPQEFDSEQIGAKRRKKVHHFGEQFESSSSTGGQQGSDPGAGPSGVETAGAAGLAFPGQFMSPWLPPFAGMSFPGLFSGMSNFGSLGAAGGFGSIGSDSGQAQYQAPDQEPSTSDMS